MSKYITSSSDIAVFLPLQGFYSSERVENRLGDNMDSACLLLPILLTFEGIVIKLLESVFKIGRELIFSVRILVMLVLFWFSSFGKKIILASSKSVLETVNIQTEILSMGSFI